MLETSTLKPPVASTICPHKTVEAWGLLVRRTTQPFLKKFAGMADLYALIVVRQTARLLEESKDIIATIALIHTALLSELSFTEVAFLYPNGSLQYTCI
jgi:hypothetical protein